MKIIIGINIINIMDDLMLLIKKNKNYYDSDIDIKDFMESISLLECKNYKKNIDEYTSDFLKKDKGEIIGYYMCKCLDLFKFYFIKVNDTLYMALENTPPYFWYKLSVYDDFRIIRKIYNKKNEKYQNKNLFIATQLWNGPDSEEYIKANIRNDYEYTNILYNICRENKYVDKDIFSKEYHYNILNRDDLSSLEYALLDKHIINNQKGFYCRTVLTNSVVSIKCISGIVFLTCYYDNCTYGSKNGEIPIDLSMFLSNFKLTTIKNIVNYKNKVDLVKINKYIPVDFYADMRDEIYIVLSGDIKAFDKDYIKLLKQLFTEHCVNRVIFSLGDEVETLKNIPNKDIRKILKTKFSEDELKYMSKKFFNKMSFSGENTSNKS
jgi:hypothetical protein